jgi:hypothetical protein
MAHPGNRLPSPVSRVKYLRSIPHQNLTAQNSKITQKDRGLENKGLSRRINLLRGGRCPGVWGDLPKDRFGAQISPSRHSAFGQSATP